MFELDDRYYLEEPESIFEENEDEDFNDLQIDTMREEAF